ncbi:MAG: ribbon-helix-helix domain-containing protein [Myxococcaceae bacterium]|nr:ribbon-helix-helix domain-containing protein [Myxococcaceae bacterium]MCI0673442.1 ribbon-helix-helix domain-containing protein [Myxococcaceae bacterium]
MKTAVSIPDPIFRDAERLARQLRKSRSQLYGDALAEYVARHAPERVVEALDRVVAEVGAEADRHFVTRAARRVLRKSTW